LQVQPHTPSVRDIRAANGCDGKSLYLCRTELTLTHCSAAGGQQAGCSMSGTQWFLRVRNSRSSSSNCLFVNHKCGAICNLDRSTKLQISR